MAFARLIAHLRAKALRTIDALCTRSGTSTTSSSPRNGKTPSPSPDTDSAERPPLLSIGSGYLTPFAEVGHRFC